MQLTALLTAADVFRPIRPLIPVEVFHLGGSEAAFGTSGRHFPESVAEFIGIRAPRVK
jgi:hypothetical protein